MVTPHVPLQIRPTLLFISVLSCSSPVVVSAAETTEEKTFDGPVYLAKEGDTVWVRKPMVYLGMVGVWAGAPVYRLSQDVARHLEPLVTRVSASSEDGEAPLPDYFVFGMPEADGSIVLLDLKAQVRLLETVPGEPRSVYEVLSADVLSAEFLTPEWLRARQQLDLALQVAVAGTFEAPGPEKRKHLEATVSHGAEALKAMAATRETEVMRASLKRIAPRARIVRSFARRIAADWGGPLRRFASALRIEPTPALPPEPGPIDALSILDSSESPREFVAKLVERHGEEALEERLFYSQEEGRSLLAWEVEEASPDRFLKLREGARKALADRRGWEAERAKIPVASDTWDVPAWGVRLRKADADACAKSLVLRASIVAELLSGGWRAGAAPSG